MKRRAGVITAIVIAMAVAVAVASRRDAGPVTQAAPAAPQLIAATFTSAWCASCRVLEPQLKKAMPKFKDKAIEFVEFDFTFGEEERLAALASAHGLTRLYEANKGATGFTVLVDADTGAVVDTLTMNFSVSDLERALAIASHTDDKAADARGAS